MCAMSGHDRAERPEDDSQIKQNAARTCVGQIHLDHLIEPHISAA
jgi:hypothetical protein